MSQESNFLAETSVDDEEIPSMLAIVAEATKVLRRMEKHALTCTCCREALHG